MGRAPCCSKVGLRRGPWSTKEDTTLTNYIQQHGEGQWRSLPKNAGLLRCGKSCRLRWMNYLRPGIKRGNINQDEEDLIVRLHRLLGNRWSLIAGRLPGRTDNEIKNYWNTHLLKKLKTAGIFHVKDSPKRPKTKKSTTAAAAGGKKKSKQKKAVSAAAADDNVKLTSNEGNKSEEQMNDLPKTKVYMPKPIRVSSVFSRTNSYDSLASGSTSSSDGVEAAEKVSYAWPPLFELEDGGGGIEDDFLGGGGFILPLLHHHHHHNLSDFISSDVHMLDKVYDEYLQLL
ncbi:hypothetical protein BUALT_Bualt05G0088800 [Buddleja alternifolia]|uniref:Uncharacterized protein n=1 Tax=Buddleja alternifolia TaxID=168488 RepID=A0AAV6XJ90_9LAMI|nr:hypothetical protein BUALT_Bualt05G0088800 [Buddleja alternifolia]